MHFGSTYEATVLERPHGDGWTDACQRRSSYSSLLSPGIKHENREDLRWPQPQPPYDHNHREAINQTSQMSYSQVPNPQKPWGTINNYCCLKSLFGGDFLHRNRYWIQTVRWLYVGGRMDWCWMDTFSMRSPGNLLHLGLISGLICLSVCPNSLLHTFLFQALLTSAL